MSLRAAAIAGLVCLAPGSCLALTLEFPAVAVPVADRTRALDSYFIPVAPYADGPLDGIVAEGAVRHQSWKVGAGGLTTLQILAPLREQLEQAGFAILFECEARICGGFDFRYQIALLPEPDMHVNLGDFRYLAARRTDGTLTEHASLMVSRSANAGFVQLTQVGAQEPEAAVATTSAVDGAGSVVQSVLPVQAVGRQLETLGYARLNDLTFKTGSSELGDEEFASLAELAAYLAERPEARIMLVGHTDAVGALDANIALSRKRATSVMTRLVQAYGVSRGQVGADGVGFLAPRSSNLTDEGRAQNRRVEVILTSTK